LTKVIQEGSGTMPGFPELKGNQVTALVRFVQTKLGTEAAGAAAPPAVELVGNPARGAALFRGRESFAQGGAACAACHRAGGEAGGCLGRDLTDVAKRYGSGGRLSATLESMPFRVMRASYAGKGLTPQERADLAAFFQSLDGRATAAVQWVERFWLAGFVGAAALFAGVAFIGSRRGVSPARRLRRVLTRGRKG
jgi:mono/diheme cytochrome c family protein